MIKNIDGWLKIGTALIAIAGSYYTLVGRVDLIEANLNNKMSVIETKYDGRFSSIETKLDTYLLDAKQYNQDIVATLKDTNATVRGLSERSNSIERDYEDLYSRISSLEKKNGIR